MFRVTVCKLRKFGALKGGKGFSSCRQGLECSFREKIGGLM